MTGAERYLQERLKDPVYRAAYERALPRQGENDQLREPPFFARVRGR